VERLLSKLKAMNASQHWVLLTNLAYSIDPRGTPLEIDIIAVGTPGIQVIEVKHWDRAYLRAHPTIVEHEAVKLHGKAQKLATTLRRFLPDLPYVTGSFLLTREKDSIGNASRPQVKGAMFYSLPEWKQILAVDSPSLLAQGTVAEICRSLKPSAALALSGELKRLADMVDLQLLTPPDERFHRIYRGRRALQRDPVILHLYDLSARDGPNAQRIASREFDTLQRLQKSRWLPRIMSSFQEVPQYPGELYYFSIVDPTAPTLEQRAADKEWTLAQRIDFAKAALQALLELQCETGGLIHRNINPRTLLVQAAGEPLLTGLHMARASDSVTVAASQHLPADVMPFTASEIRTSGFSVADARSDLYSMAATLTTAFAGLEDELATGAVDVLREALTDSPDDRPAVRDLVEKLQSAVGSQPRAEQLFPALLPNARFWSEDMLVPMNGHHYRILSKLGSGGYGTTFKVVQEDEKSHEQFGTYVAKVLYDADAGQLALRAYRQVRPHTTHPNLSVIFDTASAWSDNSIVALMKWVEGYRLADLIGVVPLYFEEVGAESSESLLLSWAEALCDALSSLHAAGLVHGDVSPRNILVAGATVVLTDYDLVCQNGQPRAALGTVAYTPPVGDGRSASFGDDLFSLGATFFHVALDRQPFLIDGVFAPQNGCVWTEQEQRDWPLLSQFVDRATARGGATRFRDAMEAARWLRDLRSRPVSAGPKVVQPALPQEGGALAPRTPNHVPRLRDILQTYPGSELGNAEARGLDSDFAADTYVRTELEKGLLEEIRSRRVRLVILCGNAGDGKTALLQHIAGELGIPHRASSERVWEAQLPDGLRVRANLDGAAAFRGRSANDLLDEFFAPFHSGPPAEDICQLLAVNDGRLLEWIERFERQPSHLTSQLWMALADEPTPPDAHIRFIDLNLRSLVGGNNGQQIDTTFPEKLVARMLGGERADEIWKPCRTCTAQGRCAAYASVRVLRGEHDAAEPGLSQRVRDRLYAALQAVHQRDEVHITTRELRGTLSYVFFGTHDCADLHANPELVPPRYYDLAFDANSSLRQGEVLRELARLDPALEAHPQVDRYLNSRQDLRLDGFPPHYPGLGLQLARRRAYFEWSEAGIVRVAGTSHALDLARGKHLRLFQRVAFMNDAERAALCRDLCTGISRLEDLPPAVLRRYGVVPLKITPRTPIESVFWVEKELARFSLQTEAGSGQRGLATLHRHLILSYQYRTEGPPRYERLRLNSELFHLLLDLKEGYQLADAVSDDLFANLSIFTQRLAQEDEQSMFAWTPIDDDRVYEVRPELTIDVRRLELRPAGGK
jgi:hypothetical protein